MTKTPTTPTENAPPEDSANTFEQMLTELETLTKRLEDGKVPLEEALALYTRGVQLKKSCEKKLHDAQLEVETLTNP